MFKYDVSQRHATITTSSSTLEEIAQVSLYSADQKTHLILSLFSFQVVLSFFVLNIKPTKTKDARKNMLATFTFNILQIRPKQIEGFPIAPLSAEKPQGPLHLHRKREKPVQVLLVYDQTTRR